jgi:hypothetical protein
MRDSMLIEQHRFVTLRFVAMRTKYTRFARRRIEVQSSRKAVCGYAHRVAAVSIFGAPQLGSEVPRRVEPACVAARLMKEF